MLHKLSDNAMKFRALILAEIDQAVFLEGLAGPPATNWRTSAEWERFSGLGCNTYMQSSTELKEYDPTLKFETDRNIFPRLHRWKLVSKREKP